MILKIVSFLLQENYEQKELNSVVPKVEPKEDTKEECEEEDPMKHLTPVQRIYASNRVNFYENYLMFILIFYLTVKIIIINKLFNFQKKAYESRMSLEIFSNKTDLVSFFK